MEQEQAEILQTCKKINEQLQIEVDDFSLEYLQSTQWYLEVLEILYPSLTIKLNSIKTIKSPSHALDQLLKVLAKQQIIEEDFLEIKGKDIVEGDIQSIYYVVQLLNALVDREIQEQEQQEQEQAEGPSRQNTEEQNGSGTYNNPSVQQEALNNQALREQNKNKQSHDKNVSGQNNFQFDSEQNQEFQSQQNSKEAHSVLGIQHQFEQSDEQDQQSNQYNQENFLQPQKNNSKINQNQNNYKDTNLKAKQVETGYKMKLQDQEQEDENDYFINNPSMKKYKSDDKMATMTSNNKKTTKKTDPQSHKGKQLISHPTIKKQYRKATNPQAKKLTMDVKSNIHQIKKKKGLAKKTFLRPQSQKDPMKQQMNRKNKQLKSMAKEFAVQRKIRQKAKIKMNLIKSKSNNQIQKVLNWKEGQLKKQKKEFEQAMQMKLQVQKQQYIKKINNLILQLQKEKQIQQRNDYKQNILKQNQEAAKKMLAMQKWYKDKLEMLRQKKTSNRQERRLLHTGHKQILKQIQKQLKRQNQKQILSLTMKYKKCQAEIQNDLGQLTSKIIQIYKKN